MLSEQLISQPEDTRLGTTQLGAPASAGRYKAIHLRETPTAAYQPTQQNASPSTVAYPPIPRRTPDSTAEYPPTPRRAPASTAEYPPTPRRAPASIAEYPPKPQRAPASIAEYPPKPRITPASAAEYRLYEEIRNTNTQKNSIPSEHKSTILTIHPIHQHQPSHHIEKQPHKLIHVPKIKYVLIGLLLSLLTAGFAAFKLVVKYEVSGNYDISRYESVLSETEKQEWQTKKANPQEVFLQLNTKIDVIDNYMANVRLINPPYSHYRYEIKLQLTGQNYVLYQTTVDPGTVIEFAELSQSLAPGDHSALVSYKFLDRRGKVVGESQVDVTLENI